MGSSLNRGAVETLLKETDVAKILNLSVVKIRQFRSRKGEEGPVFIRIGKSIRYAPSDIAAFIESAKHNTNTPKREQIGLSEIFSKEN